MTRSLPVTTYPWERNDTQNPVHLIRESHTQILRHSTLCYKLLFQAASQTLLTLARRFWQALPDEYQEAIVTNVWCGACGQGTTIVNFKGKMEKAHLILEGECQRCRGPVERLVEGS